MKSARGIGVLARCCAVSLLLAVAAHAQQAVPRLSGRVVDRADVLSDATERTLTDLLASFEQSTANQVVVLTVPSLEGEAVEQLASRVFNTWELGQADRDNGVLVLIARDEREMRIEVGYGLEGTLTDSRAGRIIRSEFVPAFRNGDYDGGTLSGVSAILGTVDGTYEPPEDESPSDGLPWPIRLLFGCTHVLLPGYLAARTLFVPGWGRYFTLVFLLLFIGAGSAFVVPWPYGLGVPPLFLLGYILADVYMSRSPKWRAVRERVAKATKKGKTTKVRIGGVAFSVGGSSSSNGGFGSSGGGFSGGGGSSGGGGASGSW